MIATTSQTNNTAVPDHDMAKQVTEFLQLLHPPGNTIELRIIPKDDNQHVKCDRYQTVESATQAILSAENDKPKAICCNLNPIRNLTVNGSEKISKKACTDDDVERRSWLFIDIDSKRPPDASATQAELDCAKELARKLNDFLASQGWPKPVITMSGNGFHLLYRIDLPNSPEAKDTIKQVLAALASKFNTEGAEIDTSVYNASRIIKIAGTFARKGEELIDAQPDQSRRHRQCQLILRPDVLQPVSLEQLRDLASTVNSKAVRVSDRKPARPAPCSPSSEEIIDQAIEHLQKIPPAVSGQGGHDKLFRAACDLVRGFNLPLDQAKTLLFDFYNERCQPRWTWDEIGHKVEDAILKATVEPGYLINHGAGHRERVNARIVDPKLLAESYLAGFRTDGQLTLRYWQDGFWRWNAGAYRNFPEEDLRVDLTRELQRDHANITQSVITNVVLNLKAQCRIQGSDSAQFWIDGNLAHGMPMAHDVIATSNGLVDINLLLIGNCGDPFRFWPLTPNLFCTTAISIGSTFDNIRWKKFEEFLASLKLDRESVELLQEYLGYCLTADTRQQKLLMLIGTPGSSKGTLLRMFGFVVGKANTCATTLKCMTERFGLEPMLDKSLVTIGDMRLSKSTDQVVALERLLSIVGQDPQSIDRKYKPEITTVLKARFLLAANELPALHDPTGAFARRLLVLHLTESFKDNPDLDLQTRLNEAKTEIFCWALEGLRRLLKRGHFVQPAGSQDILRQQLLLTQPVKQFVADRIEFKLDGTIDKQQLYKIYEDWCQENGQIAKTQNVFGKDLLQATDHRATSGQVRISGVKTSIYKGISARPPSQPPFPNPIIINPHAFD